MKWYLSSIEKLRPRDGRKEMLCGTLIHGLSAYYHAERLPGGRPPKWYYEKIEDSWLADTACEQPGEIQRAKRAFDAWKVKYKDDPLKPLYVEVEIGASVAELLGRSTGEPELDNEMLTARFDRIAEHRDTGELYMVDVKTTGSARQEKLAKWDTRGQYFMHWQSIVYLAIAKAYFAPRQVAGFIIERIRQNEPYDFDRQTIEFSEPLMSEVPEIIAYATRKELSHYDTLKAGLSMRKEGLLSGACGYCDYKKLCGASSEAAREADLQAWYHKP